MAFILPVGKGLTEDFMTAHQPMTAGDAGLLQRLALYLLDASADRIEQDVAGILLAEELGAEILGTSKLSGVALIGLHDTAVVGERDLDFVGDVDAEPEIVLGLLLGRSAFGHIALWSHHYIIRCTRQVVGIGDTQMLGEAEEHAALLVGLGNKGDDGLDGVAHHGSLKGLQQRALLGIEVLHHDAQLGAVFGHKVCLDRKSVV